MDFCEKERQNNRLNLHKKKKKMPSYKCNGCGTMFGGPTSMKECPNCKSQKIKQVNLTMPQKDEI